MNSIVIRSARRIPAEQLHIFMKLDLLIGTRVLDNLKDYAVRAVVNAVDHLGTVAYKLTDLFEQQASEISTFELKLARLNQVLLSR